MLSYRHNFHAGNHADVLKHITLMLIVQALQQKEKGFFYLDTHAGAGLYRLSSSEAQKTLEYQDGIGRLWKYSGNIPEIQAYLAQIKKINPRNVLSYYPGSPMIVANLLRKQDRALLAELHPKDFSLLSENLHKFKNIALKHENGFQQLKSTLPPKERRGIILIDPPYELKEDYDLVIKGLIEGYKRFATGTYIIWYPVVLRQNIDRMIKKLTTTGITKILHTELKLRADSQLHGMTASGLFVINPPWKLKEQLEKILPVLAKMLYVSEITDFFVKWRVE